MKFFESKFVSRSFWMGDKDILFYDENKDRDLKMKLLRDICRLKKGDRIRDVNLRDMRCQERCLMEKTIKNPEMVQTHAQKNDQRLDKKAFMFEMIGNRGRGKSKWR